MPADAPTVGETWEMTNPATGQLLMAVVTEATDTAVRLLSRQQRRISFPVRSFLLIWRFVQEAPEQPCAYADCQSQGYIQVNDLGRWVWVCQSHIPAHARPLLPTDNNFDNWFSQGAADDRCPSCNTEALAEGSSQREMEGHTIHRCGSCDTLWVRETGVDDDVLGLWAGETIQEVATLLDSLGQRVQAAVGRRVWQEMVQVLGGIVSSTGVAGVPVRMHTGDPLSVLLFGDRPSGRGVRQGVQRLGGQPNRNSGMTIPEAGSHWASRRTGRVIFVDQIRYATLTGQSGQRIRVEGTDTESGGPVEIWLEDFVKEYIPHRPAEPAIESAPCAIGEQWADSSNRVVEIVGIEDGDVVVLLESGSRAMIPTGVFRARYHKVPPRRSAIERILEDD